MGRVVTVTSGKGGVGKSTTSASLSMGLAMRGYKTLVIDFDIGLRNLDLLLGHEKRVLYDIVNVMRGEAPLEKAVIQDYRCNLLYMLPGSQTESKDVLDLKSVARMIDQARHQYDYIICDSPAGIEHGAQMAMYFADDAILVATPELPSVRDTDRMIGLIMEKSYRSRHGMTPVRPHLIINRYNPDNVDDAVHRTHFVKMDLLNRSAVHLGFRLCQPLDGCDTSAVSSAAGSAASSSSSSVQKISRKVFAEVTKVVLVTSSIAAAVPVNPPVSSRPCSSRSVSMVTV